MLSSKPRFKKKKKKLLHPEAPSFFLPKCPMSSLDPIPKLEATVNHNPTFTFTHPQPLLLC